MINKLIGFVIIVSGLLIFSVGCATAPPVPEEETPVPVEEETPEPVEEAPAQKSLDEIIKAAVAGNYGNVISATWENGVLNLNVHNFAPYGTTLTDSQLKALQAFGNELFESLQSAEYEPIVIQGYANPTGIRNEEAELLRISKARAEAMAAYLQNAGLKLGKVQGLAANKVLDKSDSRQGRGINRHVEIIVRVL